MQKQVRTAGVPLSLQVTATIAFFFFTAYTIVIGAEMVFFTGLGLTTPSCLDVSRTAERVFESVLPSQDSFPKIAALCVCVCVCLNTV